MFSLCSNKNNIRKGVIKTLHGDLKTPAFFPDATYGAVKMLSLDDVKRTGIRQILCTTLHLHLKHGDKYIKRMGKLHKFIGWDYPIITDSGGWQVFSLIHQTGKGKVTEEGAEFVMPDTGKKELLSPEKSINIQANLRSDIMIVLDDPIIGSASYKENKKSVDITVEWAKRAKDEFLKRYQLDNDKFEKPKKKRPLLFAVIQGGNYKKLREECADKLIDIGFDGYGYGGILLKDNKKKTREMLKYFSSLVPEDKIRYGMGVGKPDDIKFCIQNGYDLFDCVVPTRNGRHGQCYTYFGSINLKSSKYKYDNRAIDKHCNCEACKNLNNHPAASRAYLYSLFKVKEITAMRLCSIHNLMYYNKLINSYKE